MTIETAAAIAALDARVLNGEHLPPRLIVGTDTRTVSPASAFVALRGERFDGHAFVADAFARGAAVCIVADPGAVPAGRPALVVGDTLDAYLRLARLARAQVRGPVIAISGSAGKTTTKTLLLQLLVAAGLPATGTPENENNEVGVSRFLLGLEAGDTRAIVVEMGARKPHDIDILVAAAQPDVALLTNIGDAHLEIMGSRALLAHTKWGLFRGGARAVLNLADEESRSRAATLAASPVWFGAGASPPPADATAAILRDARTLDVYRTGARQTFAIDARVPGEHNRANVAGACAAAMCVGADPAALAAAIAGLHLPARRYETIPLPGHKRLIFDAYNASMSGTLATLDAFGQEPATRRIAVLGSMAELGADAAQMHRRVGAAAARASEIILAGGDFADDIIRGAADAGADASRLQTYAANGVAVAWLAANARPGDAILLKGSRKYRMEEIADALGAASGR